MKYVLIQFGGFPDAMAQALQFPAYFPSHFGHPALPASLPDAAQELQPLHPAHPVPPLPAAQHELPFFLLLRIPTATIATMTATIRISQTFICFPPSRFLFCACYRPSDPV